MLTFVGTGNRNLKHHLVTGKHSGRGSLPNICIYIYHLLLFCFPRMQGRRVLVFFGYFIISAPQTLSSLAAAGWRPLDLDPATKPSTVSRYLSLWKPLPNASVEERWLFSLPWRIGSHLYYVSGFLMLGSPTFISHKYHPMDGRGKPQPDP